MWSKQEPQGFRLAAATGGAGAAGGVAAATGGVGAGNDTGGELHGSMLRAFNLP